MKIKYIIFYLILIIIIGLTIYGMIYISNNSNSEPKTKFVNTIINKEATKVDNNYEWVYDAKNSTDNNLIPYINIDNAEIKKINTEFSKITDNKIIGSYIYSITGDLLSIMYKTETDKIEYKIYNINLGNNTLLTGSETLKYQDKNLDDVKNIINATVEMKLKNCKLNTNQYNELYEKTINEYEKNIKDDKLSIYVGSNNEINVLMNIYLADKVETNLINIVDI